MVAVVVVMVVSAGSAAAAVSSAVVTTRAANALENSGAFSYHLSNWGGYVAHGSKGQFTSVSGEWTIPTVSCTASDNLFGTWVGLDGSGDNTVEQTGVRVGCGPEGGSCATSPPDTQCNYAWYEMYPGAMNDYDDPVSAGDTMSASVEYTRPTFTLTISDLTQGWTETAPPQTLRTARRETCEAIMESHYDPIPAFTALNFFNVQCNGEPLQTFDPVAGCTEGNGNVIYCPGSINNQDDFSIAPAPPETINLCPDLTATVGSYFSCSITTTSVLTLSLKEVGRLPRGLTLVDDGDGSATLSGIPSAKTGGSYSDTIVATLGTGNPQNTVDQAFNLTVDQAPAITGVRKRTVRIGESLSYTVKTTGYPTPAINLAGGELPSGITLTDNGNGTALLAGTPATGSAGNYELVIDAFNGVGEPASEAFDLVVKG